MTLTISMEEYLSHFGTPRHSGRYPWGSGDNEYQSNKNFLATVKELEKQGISQVDIAKGFGMNTSRLRSLKTIAQNENKQADINQAQRLKDKGWSNTAIAERMEYPNESSVRLLLAPGAKDKADVLFATANQLKSLVEEKKFLDVGAGTEYSLKVSKNKLDNAKALLAEEGYKVHYVKVKQLGTGLYTSVQVLAAPGTTYSEVLANAGNIKQIDTWSDDGGRTYEGMIYPPKSVDSNRIKVNYAEDGGDTADGVIYLRPGVEDLSLGAASYAQVRIAVDGTHYLKGMAIYKNDLPDGVDIAFNTNKRKDEVENDLGAMKPMEKTYDGKIDTDNPFTSSIRRQNDAHTLNILQEEGSWDDWNLSISSQVLSKQTPKLAEAQLKETFARKNADLEDIKALTNPAVKKILLETHALDADSTAVHLAAAELPRQASHVLFPVNSLKETEVYAPNYNNGERVVLIRHPHGGIFEIPELIVNNKNREAKELLGTNPKDAVAINSKVAAKLSGADFDGDAVIVIPNDRGSIKTSPSLADLKNFDPKREYPQYEGMKPMTSNGTQNQMGSISNLITDMTIKGAPQSELARAVRHSMVVIDAEKHKLNYKLSAEVNGINALKKKYQPQGGAATLISRAGAEVRLPETKPRPAKDGGPIDKKTGELKFVPTGNTYVNREGKTIVKTNPEVKRLSTITDARTLSSGRPIESIYAKHSNIMKALANEARLELLKTPNLVYSPSANKAYADEVANLNAKYRVAKKNAPRERQAQILANAVVAAKKRSNPEMDDESIGKVERQALAEMRVRTGAQKSPVIITGSEWDAIQAGALSHTRVTEILKNADLDQVRKLATPRARTVMTSTKITRAKQLARSGKSQAEIATILGVSVGSVNDVLTEGG